MLLQEALLVIYEGVGTLVTGADRLPESDVGEQVKLVSPRLGEHLGQHLDVDACSLQRLKERSALGWVGPDLVQPCPIGYIADHLLASVIHVLIQREMVATAFDQESGLVSDRHREAAHLNLAYGAGLRFEFDSDSLNRVSNCFHRHLPAAVVSTTHGQTHGSSREPYKMEAPVPVGPERPLLFVKADKCTDSGADDQCTRVGIHHRSFDARSARASDLDRTF